MMVSPRLCHRHGQDEGFLEKSTASTTPKLSLAPKRSACFCMRVISYNIHAFGEAGSFHNAGGGKQTAGCFAVCRATNCQTSSFTSN